MRIVVDTNVIATTIFFGGKPLQLVKLILDGKIVTVTDFFEKIGN